MADEATYGFNKPDARALVESIGMRTREYQEGKVRSRGGAINRLCKTPVAGIPAVTGAGTGGDPYVWGSASCFPIDESTGVTGITANVVVKNSTSLDIGGGVVIQVKTVGSLNFVDVAGGCGT